MNLTAVIKNKSYKITNICKTKREALAELGIFIGNTIELAHTGPIQQDPMMLLIDNKFNIALDKQTALTIEVGKLGA